MPELRVDKATDSPEAGKAGDLIALEGDSPASADSRTTLDIYDRILRTRDRRRHGEASDTIMHGAVPTEALAA